MAAGIKYDLTPIEGTMPEMLRYDTVYRYSGGFNLDLTNLTGVSQIPPCVPLTLDFVNRKAKVVINVKVAEAYTNGETALSIKVEKNSLAYVGMYVGNGTKGAQVTAIDKSNANYDTLTIAAAFGANLAKGTVLFEASAAGGTTVKNKAMALNYAWTKVEAGATVTAIGRAFEIKKSKLIAPISSKDEENLGDRFMFINDEA